MIITLLTIIIVLSIVILVHEIGHFFSARKLGVAVEELGFGLPPRIFGIKKGRTIYSINWIPFGGFVKLKGEDGGKKEETDSFSSKKVWQRATIMSSGVFMNYFLTFILLSTGFFVGIPSIIENSDNNQHIKEQKIQVVEVQENSPAYQAGIKVGDTIISADSQRFTKVEELQKYNSDKLDTPVMYEIKRLNETFTLEISPKIINDNNEAKLGVGLVETGLVSYPWYLSVWMGLKTTIFLTWEIIKAFFDIIKNLIISQKVPADIAGPIGIAVITGQMVKLGFIYILQFTAFLSTTLAVINFAPIPALDGGRILFIIIEKIRGRAVNQRVESIIHTAGFYFLLLLIFFVSIRDFKRFEVGTRLIDFFKKLITG
jgi:regulator of sigma E protease